MIEKPASDPARFERLWHKYVIVLKDVYEMNP